MTFKQTWWDNNLSLRMEEFSSWIGGSNSTSKIYLREHIKNNKYLSIIDLGCGTATEFFAYKKEAPHIKYTGIDSSVILYTINTNKGVPMVLSPAEETGLPDNNVDCVFSRHVLEHQPDFKPVLAEMIRLGSKEAIHIFFIPPKDDPTHIGYDEKENLYHNRYNKQEINNFLKTNPKVDSIEWKTLTTNEVVLHIKLI